MQKKINNSGMSLVSVVVAIGLLSGVAVILSHMMKQGSMVVKTAEVGLDAVSFEALLADTLRDKDACTRTFGKVLNHATVPPAVARNGHAPNNANLLNSHGIFNGDGTLLWQKGDQVSNGLILKSVKIPNEKFDPNTSSNVPNYTTINSALNKGFVEVHVKLEKKSENSSYGSKEKFLKLYLTTQVYDDAGNDHRIDWCQLSGTTTQVPYTPPAPTPPTPTPPAPTAPAPTPPAPTPILTNCVEVKAEFSTNRGAHCPAGMVSNGWRVQNPQNTIDGDDFIINCCRIGF